MEGPISEKKREWLHPHNKEKMLMTTQANLLLRGQMNWSYQSWAVIFNLIKLIIIDESMDLHWTLLNILLDTDDEI